MRKGAAAVFVCLILMTLLGAAMYLRMAAAHEVVRYSERLQRQLAEVSSDLIYGLKPDTIIYVNPKAEVYGYSQGGVIGRSALEFIPREYHG